MEIWKYGSASLVLLGAVLFYISENSTLKDENEKLRNKDPEVRRKRLADERERENQKIRDEYGPE
jgi:regulator of replication initiation timing